MRKKEVLLDSKNEKKGENARRIIDGIERPVFIREVTSRNPKRKDYGRARMGVGKFFRQGQ